MSKSNYRPPGRQTPIGQQAKSGFPVPRRKWDAKPEPDVKPEYRRPRAKTTILHVFSDKLRAFEEDNHRTALTAYTSPTFRLMLQNHLGATFGFEATPFIDVSGVHVYTDTAMTGEEVRFE